MNSSALNSTCGLLKICTAVSIASCAFLINSAAKDPTRRFAIPLVYTHPWVQYFACSTIQFGLQTPSSFLATVLQFLDSLSGLPLLRTLPTNCFQVSAVLGAELPLVFGNHFIWLSAVLAGAKFKLCPPRGDPRRSLQKSLTRYCALK